MEGGSEFENFLWVNIGIEKDELMLNIEKFKYWKTLSIILHQTSQKKLSLKGKWTHPKL